MSMTAPATISSRLLLTILGIVSVLGFVPSSHRQRCLSSRRKYSNCRRLFGISEWREEGLAEHSSPSLVGPKGSSRDVEEVLRKVPIHLVNSKQVALQGETLYLQFTRDDEVRLFQQAIDHHQGVFGLGFHSNKDEILYDKISLVEIKDYNMMGDNFGIFLAVQVVGRAMILETQVSAGTISSRFSDTSTSQENNEEKQPVVALCSEILNRQELFSLAEASDMGKEVEQLIAEVCNVEKDKSCRLVVGDEDEELREDRWARYRNAYFQALESDTQGYTYSSVDNDERKSILHRPTSAADKEEDTLSSPQYYSWNELNAISWAAFSTSETLQQDETYRLAALDNDCTTNRLLLATYWLSDVLQDVKQGAI